MTFNYWDLPREQRPKLTRRRASAMTWIYWESETGTLWTVGTRTADGTVISTDSDHGNKNDARQRCHYLNGGSLREE